MNEQAKKSAGDIDNSNKSIAIVTSTFNTSISRIEFERREKGNREAKRQEVEFRGGAISNYIAAVCSDCMNILIERET